MHRSLIRRHRTLGKAIALIATVCSLSVARAEGTEDNFGIWTAVFTQGKFSDRWGWFLENQLRLHEGWEFRGGTPDGFGTRGNRLLLRPAVRWLPRGDGSLQLHLGYGWTPNFSPERGEHRLWQQALLQTGDGRGGWAIQHRLRLEQRHAEFTRGLAHRVRYFLRAHRLTSDTGAYGLALWDELFWNLNTVTAGPQAGFDQNRVFVGPIAQVAPGARLEAGYLNVLYSRGTARARQMSHILGTFLFFDLP